MKGENTMKKAFVFMLVFLLAGPACSALPANTIIGSGNVIRQIFEVSGFDQIQLDTVGTVQIVQGDSDSLTIETDDNILPYLNVKVPGDTLILVGKNNTNLEPSLSITYYLTVKDIQAITTNTSGDITADSIAADKFDIFVNGSGDVQLDRADVQQLSISSDGSGQVTVDELAAETVSAQILASGNIQLSGKADSLDLKSSGSGDALLDDLQTSNVHADFQASGHASLWVLSTLDVAIGGSGNISYYGTPDITQNLTGTGQLISLGEKLASQ
jgi:hypothetical protein